MSERTHTLELTSEDLLSTISDDQPSNRQVFGTIQIQLRLTQSSSLSEVTHDSHPLNEHLGGRSAKYSSCGFGDREWQPARILDLHHYEAIFREPPDTWTVRLRVCPTVSVAVSLPVRVAAGVAVSVAM